jgi:precorrin-6B methylase 2
MEEDIISRCIAKACMHQGAEREQAETLIAPYVPTPFSVARRMLSLIDLKPGELLFDLGCGDGRIVLIAAQEFGARAIGVELQERLWVLATSRIERLGLGDRVKVLRKDLLEVDLSSADAVTLYLTPIGNQRVQPKLEKELRPEARVVSHDYELLGWKPAIVEKFPEDRSATATVHKIFVYRKAESLRRRFSILRRMFCRSD